MTLKRFIKKQIKHILRIEEETFDPVTIYPESIPVKGRVLVSYLEKPLLWPESDARFDGHSNLWESREIVRIFNRLGYIADCISWTNKLFWPTEAYDAIFDIHSNLQRIAPIMPAKTKKILHMTTSYVFHQRTEELKRVAALEARTGRLYSPRRIVPDIDLAERSLRLADYCSLIGNEQTLSTYPDDYKKKMSLVPVSASHLTFKKDAHSYVPASREFLWFYGGGLVNKGLDLALEAFKANPHLTLNIVGKVESERDFLQIYNSELFGTANIKYHGYLYPSSQAFLEVAARCFAYIAPSCSESISTAAVTCLQFGFYPIISRSNGITLPPGCGRYLEECSIEEISQAINKAYSLPEPLLKEQIARCQDIGLTHFSREAFSCSMQNFVENALGA